MVPPAPYSLGDISCNDAGSSGDNENRTANFDLDPGEDITCTFVNVLPGTITITKVADPEDGTDFEYTTTGGNGLSDFSLDVDNDATLDDTETFTVPAGDYSVTETLLEDWDLVQIDCVASSGSSAADDEASGTVDITLADGGSVACTYVNVERGHIIVQKETTPDGDTTEFDFDASYDADGFSLADGQSNDSGPLPSNATYSVSETVPEGWDLTSATCDDGSAPGEIELDPGETVTCTFNNLKLAKIITVKETDPDGADVAFTFDPSWGANFQLQDGQQNDSGYLQPGPGYSVGELPTLGWALTSQVCVSDVIDGDSPASITLQAGETVTCTFTNRQQGEIIVEKQTLPDGDPQSFQFTASWDNDDDQLGDTFNLTDGQQESSGLQTPGTFSVSEGVPAGWDLTSAVCDDGSDVDEIVLDPGETVTCVFTNTKRGTIIVEKQTSPDGATGDFTFTGDAAGSLSDGEQIVVDDLQPGTYTSTEGDPGEDWNLGSITCDDAQSETPSSGSVAQATATFELDPGETVTCVFMNVMDGSITIIKDADPADGTDFDYTTAGDGLSDFTLDDDADATLSNTKTFLSLDPSDAYQVAETLLDGWDLAGIECNTTGEGTSATPNGNAVDMTLGDGGSITCTFFNELPSIDIVKTAGDAADGSVLTDLAGDITYTYVVTNDGANRLVDIEIVDDNGTPADTSDDFGTADGTITCDVDPRELDPGASMTCTATVPVTDSRTNIATVNGFSVHGTPVEDEDDAEVIIRKPVIDLDKSVDDEDGLVQVGDTVTFQIDVIVIDGPVTNAVVTDTLPAGQTYVEGSQSASMLGTFEQNGQVLTWTFATVNSGLPDETVDPAITITYDVTIDGTATGVLTNTAEVCVDEIEQCEGDDEEVEVEPTLDITILTPVCDGDVPYLSYDVDVTGTPNATVTVTFLHPTDPSQNVVFTDLPLTNIHVAGDASTGVLWPGAVVDAAGNPVDWPGWSLVDGVWVEGDEFDWVRPSVAVLFEVNPSQQILVDYPPASPVCNANPPEPSLFIDKANDAPIETLELPDGSTADLPTADEGETVGYTLTWTLSLDSGVSNAIITDVLPAGVTYVDGTASATDSSGQFTFQSYDDASRTLTWTAASVDPAVATTGTVTYDATVDEGAAELDQPLVNVATIDSDETEPDQAASEVFVPTIPAEITSPPTLPPTDTLATPAQGNGNTGFTMMLVLLALAAVVLVIGFVTPVPASVRERSRR